jgi:hypothetical protein
VDALADCSRDTLALAAAIDGARPLVLTALAPDESAPAVARSLEEAGVPCRCLEPCSQTHGFDAALAPALMKAGLAAAVASGGLRLAGMQVVAPSAHLPSSAGGAEGEDDRLAWNEAAHGDEACLWDGAIAICWKPLCAT